MGHMSGIAEPWMAGFHPVAASLALPLWSAALIAVLYVAFRAFILARTGPEELADAITRVGLLLFVAALGWGVLEATSAGDFAAERRALDVRLSELTTRAVMPGSALACLDGSAGELVEASCEKALFATPEAVAASVAYVTAQLSLLAQGSDYERRSGTNYEAALAGLRRAVEIDRFGIVAHVLADRDSCTAERCNAFALLRDSNQVADNLSGRKYDAVVLHHASEWLQSALSLVATNAAAPSPPSSAPLAPAPSTTALPPPSPPQASASAAPGKSNGLYFPSSASIPPVSIMTPEPTGGPQTAAVPADATKPPAAAVRKPVTAPAQPARRPAGPGAAPPAGDP
jgi:hypothetical protein